MKSMQNDMTVGNPMKIILSFTLPIFIGNVLSRIDLYDCTVAVGTMERDTGRACITACCRDARRTFCYVQKAETFVK